MWPPFNVSAIRTASFSMTHEGSDEMTSILGSMLHLLCASIICGAPRVVERAFLGPGELRRNPQAGKNFGRKPPRIHRAGFSTGALRLALEVPPGVLKPGSTQ